MTRPRILVVDDDEAVLSFWQAKLAARYEVLTSSSPESVLAMARREKPQLILCDVDMPDVDGGDISSELFADEELRGIPVLFLTGLVGPAELQRLSGQLGGRAAVSKSEPVEAIVARIESLLAG
jgi:putative two-component system response regulator